ncbi:hypothetical protein NA57DRAFT_77367 [Rhizodiscina lignyota]|uniref:MARVEL domain-containing protein n=1 Tax=Rhizodiscina lignyota TaxID=1504668 RepID=A0A9P4IEL6_9PEZI|nr:hypothetical protein NA57DRAFT_77367 [Rhizodiscina lignyota]
MAFMFTLPLRATQAVFTVIVLGLTAYVSNWWNGYWHDMSPDEINFLLFCSVWTILSLAYLIVVPWRFSNSAVGHKYGILAAEALTMLFWFAGFVALAVFLSNRVCFGTVCNIAKAATVFASLEWLVFAITTGMATLHVVRTRGTNNTRADPQMEVTESAKNHA